LSQGKEEIGPEQIIICPKLFFMIYCRKEFEGKLHETAIFLENPGT
jgi:hypothetical protein